MKKSVLLRCPCNSASGYGYHSRSLAWQLIKSGKFDIHIISTKWGNLALGTLYEEEIKRNNAIRACIIQPQQKKQTYDYYINVSIPNEFDSLGDINIGFTAGIETDRVAPAWLEKGNQMDSIFVPSNHSKQVYERSKYQKMAKENPGVVMGQLESETPIEVIFEGVDTEIFNNLKSNIILNNMEKELNEIDTEFNFLYVGHWMQGGIGEDRKNVGRLIKSFLNAFEYNPKVGLVLKTAIGSSSVPDKYRCIDRIERTLYQMGYTASKNSPKIYLVHGIFTDNEMAYLYKHKKIDAFVTLTHGEGYGRPMAESAACDLPVIAPNWSGHVDFLNSKFANLIPTKMIQIPECAVWDGVLERGSAWSDVEELDAIKSMKDVYHNYDVWMKKAKTLGKDIRDNWNEDKMGELLVEKILNVKSKKGISAQNIQQQPGNPMGIVQSQSMPFNIIK